MDVAVESDVLPVQTECLKIAAGGYYTISPPLGYQVMVEFISILGGPAPLLPQPLLLHDTYNAVEYSRWADGETDYAPVTDTIEIQQASVGGWYLPCTVWIRRLMDNVVLAGGDARDQEVLISYRFLRMAG